MSYRADIDGLRAMAITMIVVVAFHVGPQEALEVSIGGFGVDVLFVISGFLITGLLLSELEATGRIRWMNFFARRDRPLPELP